MDNPGAPVCGLRSHGDSHLGPTAPTVVAKAEGQRRPPAPGAARGRRLEGKAPFPYLSTFPSPLKKEAVTGLSETALSDCPDPVTVSFI